jgi:hypothetical protein
MVVDGLGDPPLTPRLDAAAGEPVPAEAQPIQQLLLAEDDLLGLDPCPQELR